MQPWTSPPVPTLPASPDQQQEREQGSGVERAVRVHDTATAGPVVTGPAEPGRPVRLYVCGVTPYDATHLGHAATYVAFDLLHRAWLDAGHEVHHVQNVTDVDDPLLERARDTGVDWRELAAQQSALFSADMEALSVIAPRAYVAATEAIDLVVAAVEEMAGAGAAYRVDEDTYFDTSADRRFGQVSNLGRAQMLELSAQRGGDPERPGKRDALDPLLWRARREGEPWWEGASLGPGRPGWHVECTVIARQHLGTRLDVVGGGSDLVFPHHEHSAAHGDVLDGPPYARAYVHTGMVGLDGEKMSKSKGNLVLVSVLRGAGVDPAAIRLAILAHRYRDDWSWTDAGLAVGQERAQRWRAAFAAPSGPDALPVLAAVRARLADDLDAPGALAAVDAWVGAAQPASRGSAPGHVGGAPALVAEVADALLGVRL